jgi:hypothetical protein
VIEGIRTPDADEGVAASGVEGDLSVGELIPDLDGLAIADDFGDGADLPVFWGSWDVAGGIAGSRTETYEVALAYGQKVEGKVELEVGPGQGVPQAVEGFDGELAGSVGIGDRDRGRV